MGSGLRFLRFSRRISEKIFRSSRIEKIASLTQCQNYPNKNFCDGKRRAGCYALLIFAGLETWEALAMKAVSLFVLLALISTIGCASRPVPESAPATAAP